MVAIADQKLTVFLIGDRGQGRSYNGSFICIASKPHHEP